MKKINIIFYDVTPTDREQIEPHLDSKRYDATLTAASISIENIDPDAQAVSVFADSHVSR